MIVTLCAVHALAQKCANRSSRKLVLVQFFVFHPGNGDEIGSWAVCPESFRGDQFPCHLTPRGILLQLLRQPVPQSIPAKDDERTLLDTNQTACQSIRKIVAEPCILQHHGQPSLWTIRLLILFEGPNLFQGRNCTKQRQRESAEERQFIDRSRRNDLLVPPAVLKP